MWFVVESHIKLNHFKHIAILYLFDMQCKAIGTPDKIAL